MSEIEKLNDFLDNELPLLVEKIQDIHYQKGRADFAVHIAQKLRHMSENKFDHFQMIQSIREILIEELK